MDEAKLNLDDPQGANVGTSTMARRFLTALSEQPDPQTGTQTGNKQADLFLLNCGLHDVKVNKESGAITSSPEVYRSNLEAITELMPRLADAWAWIRTTPVDDDKHAARKTSFTRYQRDVDAYNRIADDVMNAARYQSSTWRNSRSNRLRSALTTGRTPSSAMVSGQFTSVGPMKSLQVISAWHRHHVDSGLG